MNPRVCIPIAQKQMGGMYTFLGYLRAWLDAQGVEHTDDPAAEYDVLFVNSWAVDAGLIKKLKKSRPSLRVVQRIDGAGQDYGRADDCDARQARVSLYSDLSIFQSDYSLASTTEKFRVISTPGLVIPNPVDLALFNPEGPAMDLPGRLRVAVASFSLNRLKGSHHLGPLARANPEVTFVLMGRFPELPPLPNLVHLGHLGRQDMARAMRSCHVFLNLARNDSCPNVVIEALASGLPVLFRDSGGNPELVGDCGLAVTPEEFGQGLAELMPRREELSRAARARAEEMFDPEAIFPRYFEAMASARRRPLPGPGRVLSLWRAGYPVLPDARGAARAAARRLLKRGRA